MSLQVLEEADGEEGVELKEQVVDCHVEVQQQGTRRLA